MSTNSDFTEMYRQEKARKKTDGGKKKKIDEAIKDQLPRRKGTDTNVHNWL